jgi:hypothetical protein
MLKLRLGLGLGNSLTLNRNNELNVTLILTQLQDNALQEKYFEFLLL